MYRNGMIEQLYFNNNFLITHLLTIPTKTFGVLLFDKQ